jgi:hypothetical protein
MNIQWTNMTGFGPVAWNHGGKAVTIPSMVRNEQVRELVLHSHKGVEASGKRTLFRRCLHITHKPEDNIAE